MEVELLEISVRSYNALKRAGIGYICDITDKNLAKVKGIGSKSWKEIMEAVVIYYKNKNEEATQ